MLKTFDCVLLDKLLPDPFQARQIPLLFAPNKKAFNFLKALICKWVVPSLRDCLSFTLWLFYVPFSAILQLFFGP
jgi:hypothetical protein